MRVWFTDKNNPYIGTLNDTGVSYDGFLLSSNQIEGTFTQSADCKSGTFDVEWTEALGHFGWYRDIQTVFGLTIGCGYYLASVSARHANKTQFEPFYDCRDEINISYSPMTLRVNMLGSNELEGEVSVTGDFDRCGEYAQRFQDGPY